MTDAGQDLKPSGTSEVAMDTAALFGTISPTIPYSPSSLGGGLDLFSVDLGQSDVPSNAARARWKPTLIHEGRKLDGFDLKLAKKGGKAPPAYVDYSLVFRSGVLTQLDVVAVDVYGYDGQPRRISAPHLSRVNGVLEWIPTFWPQLAGRVRDSSELLRKPRTWQEVQQLRDWRGGMHDHTMDEEVARLEHHYAHIVWHAEGVRDAARALVTRLRTVVGTGQDGVPNLGGEQPRDTDEEGEYGTDPATTPRCPPTVREDSQEKRSRSPRRREWQENF